MLPAVTNWSPIVLRLYMKNSKKEIQLTVLNITKALAKTTNCTCSAKKKWSNTTIFLALCARRACAPTFNLLPAPLHIEPVCTIHEVLHMYWYDCYRFIKSSLTYITAVMCATNTDTMTRCFVYTNQQQFRRHRLYRLFQNLLASLSSDVCTSISPHFINVTLTTSYS